MEELHYKLCPEKLQQWNRGLEPLHFFHHCAAISVGGKKPRSDSVPLAA